LKFGLFVYCLHSGTLSVTVLTETFNTSGRSDFSGIFMQWHRCQWYCILFTFALLCRNM